MREHAGHVLIINCIQVACLLQLLPPSFTYMSSPVLGRSLCRGLMNSHISAAQYMTVLSSDINTFRTFHLPHWSAGVPYFDTPTQPCSRSHSKVQRLHITNYKGHAPLV